MRAPLRIVTLATALASVLVAGTPTVPAAAAQSRGRSEVRARAARQQQSVERQVFHSLQSAATALAATSTAVSAIQSLRDNLADLRETWRAFGGKPLQREYLDDLRRAATLLRQALDARTPARRDSLVGLVGADLEAKAELAGPPPGGVRSPTAVFKAALPVAVRTLRGGMEVPGLLVACTPKLWASEPGARYPFGRASSPTIAVLPAGNYVCWTQRGAGATRVGTREVRVSIPELQGDTARVDLILPP